MLEIYRALFVDPSLEALIPIVAMVVAGAVLSTIKRIARLGVTILVAGVLAFLVYLAWRGDPVASLMGQAASTLPY